jgi:hypothetical protein
MKFEMVEQPGWDARAGDHADIEASPAEEDDADAADPIQGLKVGTARLVSSVQAEAQQIGESVAEITDLAAQAAGARIRQHSRVTTARPPASFRAARFGGSPRTHGPEITFAWPTAGEIGSTD